MPAILIIDDDPVFGMLQKKILIRAGRNCEVTESGADGLRLIREQGPGIILLDIHLRDMSGIALLKEIKALSPLTEIIMITGDDDTKTAIDCIRQGAFEYLTKPLDQEELLVTVEKAEQTFRLVEELNTLRTQDAPEIIGRSRAALQIRKLINNAARVDTTVLITGETGSGKEVVARHIHASGNRQRNPFVAVNCAGTPESLIASEFFGFARGTFTGASRDRQGFFERANSGTIFLDEIGDMPMVLQTALLRLLEERVVTRIGGEEVKLDVRVLCATNHNLARAVADGTFREDLYYRINVLEIPVPPLRDRTQDIIPLAEYFLRKFFSGKRIPPLGEEARRNLLAYRWPGNIRELRNVVERETFLNPSGTLSFAHLLTRAAAPLSDTPQFTLSLPDDGTLSFAALERRILEQALEHSCGNVTRAAALLKLQRSSFRSKLKKHSMG